MEWFENWFNSPYYSILYKNRNDAEATLFIDNLISYIQPPSNASVLDIPCGNGRHSVYLYAKGFNVTGVDLSENHIYEAKKKETSNLQFRIHDMRIPFAQNTFDLVLNIFTSFGYFSTQEDELNTIQSFSSALKKNGSLVLDFMNTDKVIRNLVAYETKKIDNLLFTITKEVTDQSIVKKISVLDGENRFSYYEKVKALYLQDFVNYFNFAGLKLVSIFGDYALGPFDIHTSDRLILIAKKK
jgi:SAM-dependent methyltransferase